MSATNRGAKRRDNDCYPTPLPAIDALLPYIQIAPGTIFLEPCKGKEERILQRIPCDMRLWCELAEGVDYLTTPASGIDLIITNPPFALALEFLQKSLTEAATVIYLLRLNFLGSQKRRPFWRANRPSHVLVLAERPCFTGDGKTDSIEYAWFCWDRAGMVTLPAGVHVL
jgi:hypothetical protein